MTREQAKKEFQRLCDAFDRTFPREKEPTVLLYFQALEKRSYELGRAAITKAIETCERWPTIGQINRIADDLGHVGAPNAIAQYTEPNRGRSPAEIEHLAWEMWRADRLRDLDEADYWSYTLDRQYREKQDALWRQQWENERANERLQRGGKLAAIGGGR